MLCLDYSFFEESYGVPDTYLTAVAVLKKSNGNKIVEFKPDSSIFQSHISICLPPGQYALYLDCPDDMYDYQYLAASYKKKVPVESKIGGGLRIHKITHKDESVSVAGIERYEYADSGQSTGRLMSPLKYFYNETLINANYIILPGNVVQYIYQGSYVVRSSASCIPLGNSAQGNPLGYSKVIKYDESFSGVPNGKTISYFQNTPEQQTEYFLPGAPNRIFNDNGYLMKTEEYNGSDQLVRKKAFAYTKVAGSDINVEGVKTYKFYGDADNLNVQVRFYDHYSEWWHPVVDTTYTYSCDGTGSYVKTTSWYYFENSIHKLLTRKVMEESDGTTIESRTRYPRDINVGPYASMATLNMHNYPVEQVTLRNDKIVGSRLTMYKAGGNSYVPDKIYSLETATPLSSLTYFNGTTKDGHYSSTPEIIFNQYDSKSHVLQTTGRDGIVTSWLWGVTGNYMKAQVNGASYSMISSYDARAASFDSKTLYDSLTGISGLPSDAMITTYSYQPLVGLTSQTDSNGLNVNYEYNPFGWLQCIKDDDGNILKYYEYHYSNQ